MNWMNRFIATTLPAVPKPIVRFFSKKYIAGNTINDAVRTIKNLQEQGCIATVDVLGENIKNLREADKTVHEYLRVLDRIEQEQLNCNVSIKLTQFGLVLDKNRCYENVHKIVESVKTKNNFLRVDMEDSECTTSTLEIFSRFALEYPENVGIVIQAYLRRSMNDISVLLENVPKLNVRLCKGIYVEPRQIAFKDPAIINYNFMALLEKLFEGGAYVGIATHDERLVWHSQELIRKMKIPHSRYEYQMLLGVDEELRQSIVANGHRLRVYVPYGQKWYAYSLRRLKENPQIAGYVLRGMLHR
ncbi:proline dehydrogenase family protein [candidate division KSB1 bacterium]|nr:proline dehydrogenase family protein [candidate division KSB1 bacterium]